MWFYDDKEAKDTIYSDEPFGTVIYAVTLIICAAAVVVVIWMARA